MANTTEQSRKSVRPVKAIVSLVFVALAAALMVNAVPRTDGGTVSAASATSGADLFSASCARCHGEGGKGGKGPNLASEKRQAKWRESDEKLVKKITNGGLIMPSFKKKLKPEEIQAIADYVRTLKE